MTDKTIYRIIKRDVSWPCFDAHCSKCDWTSSGWDFRRNAVRAGYFHVKKEHPKDHPRVAEPTFNRGDFLD